MPHPILEEDWEEYDNKKIVGSPDRGKVACTEQWEKDYITKRLREHFPYKTDNAIKEAIDICCRSVREPRPRAEFLECVTKYLSDIPINKKSVT